MEQQGMDPKAPLWAWVERQTGIRSGERYVLEKMVALANPAPGEPAQAYPKARTIGERCNLHERNVRAIWQRLVALGLLVEAKRRGQPSVWTFCLGIVVAKQPRLKRPARAPATPAESSGVNSGRNIRPTPAETPGGSGRNIRPTPAETPDRGSREVEVRERRKGPRLDTHTPPEGHGERRTAARPPTDYRIPCRDDGTDGGGARVRTPGVYALTELQVAKYQQDHALLERLQGVKGTLLKAVRTYGGYLEKGVESDDYLSIPAREQVLRRLGNVWLGRDEQNLTRGGKQSALPLATGTEG
jgi:hypothetical protein